MQVDVQVTAPPKLRVLAEPRPLQDCTRCRCLRTCWASALKPRTIAMNLLVCRMERGIDRDKATRTLLILMRPKIRRVARSVARSLRTPPADLAREIESYAIENLLTQYVVGERAHPLNWLFGDPHGAVTCWIRRRLTAAKREDRYFIAYDRPRVEPDSVDERILRANYAATGGLVTSPPPAFAQAPAEFDEGAAEHGRAARILETLDDGVSLSASEYRIVSFCLRNAKGDTRGGAPASGLHGALSVRLQQSRQVVTRVYGEGVRRLIEASGEAQAYLRSRGLMLPQTQAARRRRHRQRLHDGHNAMGAEEIVELIDLRRRRNVPYQDLAWMFGVSGFFVRMILRRFEHLPAEEILRTCRR